MKRKNKSLDKLSAHLLSLGRISIAVSGGVDSMTLAVVANRVRPGCKIFHAISPAVPASATARVKRYAENENWDLRSLTREK